MRLVEPDELTYPGVGQTRGDLPAGYHHLRRRAPLGDGPACFARASRELLGWQMHRRAGLRVDAAGPVAEGRTAVLRLGVGRLEVRTPVRVVHLVDEPRRQGFAYGTLPGHPECGEECFVVEHLADGTVILKIAAFSRPASRLARLGGPLGRWVQRRITERYLRALSD